MRNRWNDLQKRTIFDDRLFLDGALPLSFPEDAGVIFTGDNLFAIKVFAAASPVAGLAAFAHVRARSRRARAVIAESTRHVARSAIIEIQASAAADSGSVSIELTPHLLACLAAANSAHLPGYSTPDSVMMAPAVEATWKTQRPRDTVEFQAPSKLIVSREFVKVRSSSKSIESIRVPLRELLDAHRSTEERPCRSTAEPTTRSSPPDGTCCASDLPGRARISTGFGPQAATTGTRRRVRGAIREHAFFKLASRTSRALRRESRGG